MCFFEHWWPRDGNGSMYLEDLEKEQTWEQAAGTGSASAITVQRPRLYLPYLILEWW